MTESLLITIDKAAELLGVSQRTLVRWDKSGKLPAFRHDDLSPRRYRLHDIQKIVNYGRGKIKYSDKDLLEIINQ